MKQLLSTSFENSFAKLPNHRPKIFGLLTWIAIFLIFIPVFCFSQGQARVNIFLDNPNWEIPYTTLNPSGVVFGPIGSNSDLYPNIGSLINVTFDNTNQKVIVPSLPAGIYKFYFYKNSGDGNNSLAFVVVSKSNHIVQGDCCPDDCDLVCNGDFEDYPMLENKLGPPELIFGASGRNIYRFNGYFPKNLAHITCLGQNRVIKLSHRCPIPPLSAFAGSYIIKLRDAIKPSETANISFKATAFMRYGAKDVDFGKVKFYGLENDLNPNLVNVDYPSSCNTTPINMNGTLAYCMMTNTANTSGIPIPLDEFESECYSLSSNESCEDVTFGENRSRTMDPYSFLWTNNTTKNIRYIMIVTGQYCNPILLPEEPSESNQCYLIDYLLDDISVKTQNPGEPLCIIGDSATLCTGNCTHIFNYQVCWCAKSGTGPKTFKVRLDPNYAGINIILPSGNFDANGEATFTIANPGDCVNLSFEADIPMSVLPGNYEIPLKFDENADCSMCGAGFYIKSQTPVTVNLTDCNFTCKCEEPNNVGAKNTTTLWSSLTAAQKSASCMAVEGNLLLDEEVYISDKEFIMQDDSRITLTDKAAAFNNCNLHGCELLWKGIVIPGPGGALEMLNSTIEDAREAIDRNSKEGFIIAQGNTFNNNYVGIRMYQLSFGATTPAIIRDNTFTSNSLLDDPNYHTLGKIGYAGITITNANENIGNTNSGNTFSNLANGIVLSNSNCLIHKNIFNQILNKNYYQSLASSGNGVYTDGANSAVVVGGTLGRPNSTNTFNNNFRGIYSKSLLHATNTAMDNVNWGLVANYASPNAFYASGNDIAASRFGILISASDNYLTGFINNNTITNISSGFSMNGIFLSFKDLTIPGNKFVIKSNNIVGNGSMERGISINNASNIFMNQNTIQLGRAGARGIMATSGINLSIQDNTVTNPNSLPSNAGYYFGKLQSSVIKCNYADHTGIGFKYTGQNTSTDMIVNNMVGNLSLGLSLTAGATLTASENNGIQLVQGNLWDNFKPGVLTALHEGTDAQIRASLFRTHDSSLPIFPTGFSAPGQDLSDPWFDFGVTQSDKTRLGEDCELVVQQSANTDWLTDYADININYAIYDTMLKSQGQYLAHNFMQRHPTYSYSTALQNFYTAYSATDAGQISALRMRYQKALDLPPMTDSLISNYLDSIYLKQDAINSLIVSLGSSPTPAQIAAYQTQAYALNAEVDAYKIQIRTLRQAFKSDLSDSLDVYHVLLSTLNSPAGNIPMQNMLAETKIEVDYLRAPVLGLLPAEVTSLLEIANQCPEYGGHAVYWSRSLLNKEYPNLSWNDDILCTDTLGYLLQEPPVIALKQATFGYHSYPNPSNGSLQVMAPADFRGFIEVLDAKGSVIYKSAYQPDMRINLLTTSGLVFIKWTDPESRLLHIAKHVILN